MPDGQATKNDLIRQLHQLGITPGMVLVVHSSFKAVGAVEDGPRGLIGALVTTVGPRGTLVMPSMAGSRRPEPYDPQSTPTRNMGIVAETFWRVSGVLRSGHPTSAFAAFGPEAPQITASQPLEPVHGLDSPIGRVYTLDGWVLLLGVGQDANTIIHLGETLSRVPYTREKWTTVLENGEPRRVNYREIDHCCVKFALVDDWLRDKDLLTEGPVGHASAGLMRARDVVEVVQAHLARDPTAFLHPRRSGCTQCDQAWNSFS